MIRTLFLSVLEVSITTSLIVLLLLLFAPLLNKRYAAKWKYWLWIVLAVRLLILFNGIESEAPVVVDIPEHVTIPLMIRDTDTVEFTPTPNGEVVSPNVPESKEEISGQIQQEKESVDVALLGIVAYVWGLGCLTMLAVHGISYARYKRQIFKNGALVEDDPILCQLHQLTEELQIRQKIIIMEYFQAASPMIIGFFHPILVLPDRTYCQEELYFILKHELIHLKRHDIYFKLLMVAANAVHWFNPIIWVMRKEATIDMELSCDERVVQGMNFATRKAYMETLLSTLHRQSTKRSALSTQFYGGKQVMKKRFQNILMETRKKNGFSMVVCAFVLTLALGSLIGCSINETAPDETEPSTQVWQSQPGIPMETELANFNEMFEETLVSDEEDGVTLPDLSRIHVSQVTGANQYCSREEYPSLYEDMGALLLQRQRILNSILSIEYGKPNENETITGEDGRIYYFLTERSSLEEVKEELKTVYTEEFLEGEGAWYLDALFLENRGKLYRIGGDGWEEGLYDNWVIWKLDNTDDTDYYIQGYKAIGAYAYGEYPILSIFRVTQTEEGLRICFEMDMNFSQNIYAVPEDNISEIGARESGIGNVNTDALKVRTGPYEDANVIALLPIEQEITILEKQNEFYRILWQEEDKTVEGYVKKEYVDVE